MAALICNRSIALFRTTAMHFSNTYNRITKIKLKYKMRDCIANTEASNVSNILWMFESKPSGFIPTLVWKSQLEIKYNILYVVISGVRYRKFSYHDYWTQYIAIWYISRYTANHLACVFKLMILVPLMYKTMVHNTTHSFNNKITDILCTFSLVTAKIYT